MRTLLAALVAVFLCLPAGAQEIKDECIPESRVMLRVLAAIPGIALQARIAGPAAEAFSGYIERTYGVPASGDLILRFGKGDIGARGQRLYVVFFKAGCLVHDSFVSRARYEADRAKALGSGI